jgi:hypothetical protein
VNFTYESDDPAVRAHDERVRELIADIRNGLREGDENARRLDLVLRVRCEAKSGKCAKNIGWVGVTAFDGLLAQVMNPSSAAEDAQARKRWQQSTVLAGRRPTGMRFDLLEHSSVDRRPPLVAECTDGHGPWTLDRARLLHAARSQSDWVWAKDVAVTPH